MQDRPLSAGGGWIRRTGAASLACAALLSLARCGGCDSVPQDAVTSCSQAVVLPGQAQTDILFVVDDSGSMDPAQQNLAANFDAFIAQLAATEATRAAAGFLPLDFHVAVTTSSVFIAEPGMCSASLSCGLASTFPAPSASTACSASGAPCVGVVDRYYGVGSGCSAGPASNGAPYPAGDFVAAAGNPKVLHFQFTAAQWATWGTGAVYGPLQAAVDQFRQNVVVGSCGSGEEQHLEGARLALKKALHLDGLAQPPDVLPAEWPHPGAKLVVVWVGNEDDCSNPEDPARALVYSGSPGADMCTADQGLPPGQQTLFPVNDYLSFLAGLGRPLGAAFIYGGTTSAGTFVPGDCSCPTGGGTCGYGPGTRFKAAADGLRGLGASVVEGSICDQNFSATLQQIAALVDPGQTVSLSGAPADWRLLRVEVVRSGAPTTCSVGLAGTPGIDVVYQPPQAGLPPSLTFQGACILQPGDSVQIQVVCAG